MPRLPCEQRSVAVRNDDAVDGAQRDLSARTRGVAPGSLPDGRRRERARRAHRARRRVPWPDAVRATQRRGLVREVEAVAAAVTDSFGDRKIAAEGSGVSSC